ncbi:hypothetical protein LEP3755_64950 (plasmid) [Leptolyngbya sp. NIES-3755]|nr:hypothetical protein LEP3755_64950 [Leptolyngbya sp. NIES-3755]
MDDSEMPKEATEKAIDRYRASEKGKAAQRRSQRNYAETEKGVAARKRASQKFESENADARREYKRKKQAEYRAKQKQRQNSTSSSETTIEEQNNLAVEPVVSFPEGCVVQTKTGQIGQVVAVEYTVKFEDGSTQTFPGYELTRHDSHQ